MKWFSFYRRQKCRGCGRYGHIKRMCKGHRVDMIGADSRDEDGELPLLNVQMVNPGLNGRGIQLDIKKTLADGAGYRSFCLADIEGDLAGNTESSYLNPSGTRLKTYSGEALTVLGQCTVEVECGQPGTHYCGGIPFNYWKYCKSMRKYSIPIWVP